jgi:hypothetical protein
MAKDPILEREILRFSDSDSVRFRDIIDGGQLQLGAIGAGKTRPDRRERKALPSKQNSSVRPLSKKADADPA